VLLTDLDEAAAVAAAAELGEAATGMGVDVRDHLQLEAARDAIVQRAGRLDVWVNNAGVLLTGPAWEQTAEQRRLMFEVNALGAVNGTVTAIDAMRPAGGHVVNIVSLAGLSPVPGEAVYAGTKHAVLGFSLSTLADLRLAGITNVHVSCVCPDGIWTPMLHDKLDDPASALSFSGKLLEPAEVVAAVARLLDHPRPVAAVPAWRGVQARIAGALPGIGLRAMPLVVALGRRNQRRYAREGLPADGDERG
jgi:NAD(P)-dependent dehydrogenase (short-subunit alcohol dehydrogenase family)